MSHPTNHGNGCSLEDCHTNLFALTDLDGIKWRRLDAEPFLEPLEDPVLQSFTKCIQADVLCVWRRVQKCSDQQRGPDQLVCNKELCIFWYGEEPHTLNSLLSPDLKEVDRGSWDQGGLPYECRTLLFKALHNLIERCLLSQNFVRVGRWFVQPCEQGNNSTFTEKGAHLSIRFSFFLHGESQVCASIDVRQHTPLRRLQPFHLQYAQNSSTPNGVNVILAPYGLSGTLTGVTYKDTDFTQRLLDEWRQFYVLKDADMREAPEANRVPPAVEVIVAGVRMRYPSTFVLVTADIENEVMARNNTASGNVSGTSHHHQIPASVHHGNLPLTPPTSPLNATFGAGADPLMKIPPPEEVSPVGPGGLAGLQILSHRVMEKVWQDDAVAAGLQLLSRHHQSGSEAANGDENVGVWDISDPTQKSYCACSKGKSGKGRMGQSSSGSKSGATGANKHSKSGDKPDKTSSSSSSSSSRHSRLTTPFHRRPGYTEPFLHGEVDLPAPRVAAAAAAAAAAATANANSSSGSFKGPMSNNPSIPTLGRPTNFDQSLDSPSSAAPSPLVATPREPSVSQNGDPTMPTLSPQRLPAPSTDAAPLTNGDTGGGTGGAAGEGRTGGPPSNTTDMNTTPATPTSQPTVDTYGKPPSAPPPSSAASTPGAAATTPTPTSSTTPPSGRPEVTNHSSSNHLASSPYQPTPTPPVPAETKVETVNQWLEQAKQQHDTPGAIKRPLLPTKTYNDHDEELVTESLYDFETLEAWLEQPMKRQKSHDLQQDMLKSHHDASSNLTNSNSNSQLSRRHEPPPTPPSTTDDPYLFSDENSTNAGSFSNKRLSMGRSREDSFPRPTFRTDEPSSQRSSDSSFGMKDDSDMSPPPVDAAPPASSGPLLTERDLKPTFNDLDKLFESSDSENSEPDPFPVPTPPGSKGMDEPKMLGSKDGRLGTTDINATDLAVMYPTPPSLDNAHNPLSPVDTQDQTILDTHQTILRTDTFHLSHLTEDLVIKDWSYVFKPPQHAVFLGSQLYKPIDLPSSRLPPLSPVPQGSYKPSWVYPLPMIEKHHHHHQVQNHYPNLPSVEMTSMGHKHQTMMEAPSPATFMSTNQRTPMSYELQSPASNASSYLNKNMSSVDNTMHTNSQVPEVHSLAVNILLSDSILNLFKDHNFDSCTICVCNMNIKGADMGVYLTDKSNEAQYRCTCGFSAVTNRKYGARSGLFYEDEVDITGIRDERLEQRKPRLIAPEHLQNRKELELPVDVTFETLMLLRMQFSALFPSAAVLHHYYRNRIDLVPGVAEVNLLEMQDGCEACYTALEAGRQVMDNCTSTRLEDPQHKATCLHKWPYVLENASVPSNSQVVLRLLNSLQPLLQDTIQKKRGTMFWESVHTVSGPLTWKDFHLLAGRGSDEASEPQPVPPIIVGYEKEWLSLSPYAFGFWDKLILEPYGRQRDVAYIVVAPDNDFILTQLLGFFKELSTVYELLKLGRHCPLSKTLRDGIMRVGKAAAAKVADEPVDEWFSYLGNSPVSAKLKLYAQVCQYRLAPYLARETIDKSLFDNQQTSQPRPAPKASSHPEPSPQPATPSQDSQPATPSSEERGDSDTSAPQKEVPEVEVEQDGTDGPSIVIYMIDPFTYGADWDHVRRLSMLGLLRCYQGMLSSLPEAVLNNIQLQLVPLQTVLDFRESATIPYLKQLSMSVYTHCRRHVAYTPLGRSLTGFGPTACSEKILKAKDHVPGRMLTAPLFTPPFILAPQRESELQLTENVERAGVMFCAYCLSEDQRWLLVSVTDDRGELLETCTINIEIPNRNRRKKASARRIGLAKLWDFVLGVMSTSAMSWRLVVGRFGRMGHGELKGWAGLLSRKNLALASKQLRDMCGQCGILNSNEVPCILSACLISMEVHQSIHIMTDSVKDEEKRSSNIAMSTPGDASCTHILVFPTSATAQPNAAPNAQENEMDIGPDLGEMDDNLFTFPEDDLGDMSDLQMFLITPPSPGSPKNTGSAPGSPTRGGEGRSGSPTQHQNGMGKASQQGDPQDETPNLLQQPLAMGFYVSTSPSGPIPKWFWAACPHRQNVCPTCFKAALHIHCPMVQQNQDEFTHNTQSRNSHPLDSSLTCDVLRYVLETYNALSWLTMDAQTNERRSCLPAHFLVLLQLYHAIEAFV